MRILFAVTCALFLAIGPVGQAEEKAKARPTAGLNDPNALRERAEVSLGSIQCAVGTIVIALTGGMAAALTPDVNELIFGAIQEQMLAEPETFSLPKPIGVITDGLQRIVERIVKNPGMLTPPAMTILMAKTIPGGMNSPFGAMFTNLAIIRTMAQCGTVIYRGVIQLSKDIPAAIEEVRACRASRRDLERHCANPEGWVSCQRTCRGTPQALDRWMTYCPSDTPESEAYRNVVSVGVGNYCFETFCRAGRKEEVTTNSQCGLIGVDTRGLQDYHTRVCVPTSRELEQAAERLGVQYAQSSKQRLGRRFCYNYGTTFHRSWGISGQAQEACENRAKASPTASQQEAFRQGCLPEAERICRS